MPSAEENENPPLPELTYTPPLPPAASFEPSLDEAMEDHFGAYGAEERVHVAPLSELKNMPRLPYTQAASFVPSLEDVIEFQRRDMRGSTVGGGG